jgi:hypothetical protein
LLVGLRSIAGVIDKVIRRNFFFSAKELDEIRKSISSSILLVEHGTDTSCKLGFDFLFCR